MHADCEECQRLWRDYGAAILAHVAFDNKLRLAALSHETEKIAILTLAAEDA